ncbi:hypothetical protein KY330_01325 [Candidatus Woesearchaeota archaeon]|nr:hypothetical protein [Candidatus Woesearchaeota archaeon]
MTLKEKIKKYGIETLIVGAFALAATFMPAMDYYDKHTNWKLVKTISDSYGSKSSVYQGINSNAVRISSSNICGYTELYDSDGDGSLDCFIAGGGSGRAFPGVRIIGKHNLEKTDDWGKQIFKGAQKRYREIYELINDKKE